MDDRDHRDDETDFRLPPVPLASGHLLPAPDGRRVTAVRLVLTTEDGGETPVPLREEHGAWWAPRP